MGSCAGADLEQSLMLETFDWEMNLILNATSLRKLSLDIGFDQSRRFLERLCHVISLHSLESFKLARAHKPVEHLSGRSERSRNTLPVKAAEYISAY